MTAADGPGADPRGEVDRAAEHTIDRAIAELRSWIAGRVAELVAGVVDARVRVPLAHPAEAGAILQLHLAGKTQREIASARGVSLGLVNKRLAEGTSYLAVLQGIERGLL